MIPMQGKFFDSFPFSPTTSKQPQKPGAAWLRIFCATLFLGLQSLLVVQAADTPAGLSPSPYPFHRAAQQGDLAGMRALVRGNPAGVNTTDPDGVTPLFVAARFEN